MTKPHPASFDVSIQCKSVDRDINLFDVTTHFSPLYATIKKSPAHTSAMTINYDTLAYRVMDLIFADSKEQSSMTLNYNRHASMQTPVLATQKSAMTRNYAPAVCV